MRSRTSAEARLSSSSNSHFPSAMAWDILPGCQANTLLPFKYCGTYMPNSCSNVVDDEKLILSH